MKSSDPFLHTVHMSGSADYNLPFYCGAGDLPPNDPRGNRGFRCNAGHVWMNSEMVVAKHPYYTVTDAEGNFELEVPPASMKLSPGTRAGEWWAKPGL